VQGLAGPKSEVEIVGNVLGKFGDRLGQVDAAGLDIPRLDADRDLVVPGRSRDLGHFGQGEKLDVLIVLDALELDFQAAGRGAQLGKIFVELHHPAAEKGIFLDDVDFMADFRGFECGGNAAEAAADDQYCIASHRNLPAMVKASKKTA